MQAYSCDKHVPVKNLIKDQIFILTRFLKMSFFILQIDPYDYEILMFIFERVIHINPSDAMRQKHRLLEFLSVYQRVEPPSEYELTYRASADEHDHLTHEGVSISPLSKTRLPFHPLFGKNLWKILCEYS